MKPKNKVTLSVAALQLAAQALAIVRARQKAEQQRPAARAQRAGSRVIANARSARERAVSSLPSHRAEQRRHRALAAGGIVGAVLAVAGAVAAYLVRRRDVFTPGPVEVAKARLEQGEVAGAVKDAALQTGTAMASGASLTKTAAAEAAHVAVDEKVVQPAKQAAVKWGSIGVAALAAVVFIVAVLGTLTALWLYNL
jgi:hypothetical protein